MPSGGSIDVTLDSHEGGARLRVRDSGVGMDAGEQAHLFDLFYTTKQGGTGLGLPLTQQIVLAHGGRIRCESERDKGTTFELWFPAEADSTAADDSLQPDQAATST